MCVKKGAKADVYMGREKREIFFFTMEIAI